MLVAHSDMLSSMLAAAYPDHEFVEWAFQKERVPNYFWSDTTNHKRFFDWVMREANMKDLSGWYILHNRAFHKLGGTLNQNLQAFVCSRDFLRRNSTSS
jgi:hypothetical protein